MQSADLTSLATSFERLSIHDSQTDEFFTTDLGKIALGYIDENSNHTSREYCLQSLRDRLCCGTTYALMIAASRHLQNENSPISFTANRTEILFFQILEELTTRRYFELREDNRIIKKIDIRDSFSLKMRDATHHYLQRLGNVTDCFRIFFDLEAPNFQELFNDIIRKSQDNFIELCLFYNPPLDSHSICILSMPHYVVYDAATDSVQWYFEKQHLIQHLFEYIQIQKETQHLLGITLDVFAHTTTLSKQPDYFHFLPASIFGIIGSYLEPTEVRSLQREAALSSRATVFLREEFTTAALAEKVFLRVV